MKLLIVTQKVDINDSNLGFFHRWIEEFAKHYERVEVICLEKGKYNFSRNVFVSSLGKEDGRGRIFRLIRFLHLVNILRYDRVFVHMNPEYVILGGPIWHILGMKVAFWYTHKAVNLRLRLAVRIADVIFSASRESFRLATRKLKIVGHGIDTELFKPSGNPTREHTVLTVGRISPTKQIKEIIEVVDMAKKQIPDLKLQIIGAPYMEKDKIYFDLIKDKADFVGTVSNINLPEYYGRASVFINLSNTGSLDKAVLEALACECQVITTNEAFRSLGSDIYVNPSSADILAKILVDRINVGNNKSHRQYVVENHSLSRLVTKLVSVIDSLP